MTRRRTVCLATVALAFLGILTIEARVSLNERRFKSWAAGQTTAPITSVTIQAGHHRAICTSQQLLHSLAIRSSSHATTGQPPKRYDNSDIKFADGTAVHCDGGIVSSDTMSFELDDRSIEFDIRGVDRSVRQALVEYLFESSGTDEQHF